MTQHAPDKRFKVCLVSISLARGGAERSCALLSQMLSNEGHDVHIALLNDKIDFPYSGTIFNLGLLKDKKDTALRRFLRIKKLRRYLRLHQFDLIIDHRGKNEYRRELFYAKYIYKGIKRMYVVHSANSALYFTQFPKKMAKIYRQNTRTICVSKFIKNNVEVRLGINNCTTVYNAYDPNWGKNEEKVPETLVNKDYILSYGRLDDDVKDFSFLLHSFSVSKVWEQGIYLVILGDGPHKEALIKLSTQLAGADHILFLPFTNAPFSIIVNARFVTLTSYFEGFPMVLVESLSLGTPVVSLDIESGPSEVIVHQKNGLLIPKRSIPLFAEAISTMSFDEVLYKKCKHNAKASVGDFSTVIISQQWNQLLHDALS